METDGEFLPRGGNGRSYGVNRLESSPVGGVGHNTHKETVGVAGVGFIEPETHLQGVEGWSEQRQNHIAPSGIGRVDIHRLATEVAVRSGTARILAAIVGFLIPAVGQGVGHCGRPGLEVLEERHRSGAAFGAELEGGVKQCVGAVGGDAHFVLRIGSKAADGDIG